MAICLTLPAMAEVTGWRLGLDVKSFDYRESSEGQLLDREAGWLPGIAGSLDWRTEAWSLSPEFAWHVGKVDYDGQTQTGLSHHTDSDTQLLRVGLLAAYRLPVDKKRWSLTAGLHRMQWDREIRANNGIAGIDEYYRWNEGSVGLLLAVPSAWLGTWQLHMQYLHILSPTLEAIIPGYDPLHFALGTQHGWRVGLTLPLTKIGQGRWSLEPYWERWHFGHSNFQPLTQGGQPSGWLAREPDSLSEHWGLRLSYRFDG